MDVRSIDDILSALTRSREAAQVVADQEFHIPTDDELLALVNGPKPVN
jgi:hypothetical protein